MLSKEELIKILKSDEIKAILKEIWVEHLFLVWSFSRWENTENSDLDLVYQENKKIRVWWIKFLRNKFILEDKLKLKIDLIEENSVNKHYKKFIEQDKRIIF